MRYSVVEGSSTRLQADDGLGHGAQLQGAHARIRQQWRENHVIPLAQDLRMHRQYYLQRKI